MKKDRNEKTIYWHDYETFGISPQYSGVAQFAGIRTDSDLNIIGEPDNFLCRLTPDRLPSPSACMVTHISPLENNKKGMTEVSFFETINKILSKNNTCGVGYNSLMFDDEVTRNGLYRNFIDPYEREWKNGCSRWDLLDVLRIIDAVKPNTFIVPRTEDGKKCFKLDQLSVSNKIEHENAHDALSDVYALIAISKIVKEKEPELFNELFNRRDKNGVNSFLLNEKGFLKQKPFLMASSFFGADQDFVEMLYPIYISQNEVHCLKLTKDLNQLFEMSDTEIKANLFKKKEDAEDGFVRPPIHSFRINKCPILLETKNLKPETAKLLGFDGNICRNNIKLIKENILLLTKKLERVFSSNEGIKEVDDVDGQIYGKFFSYNDKMKFKTIKETNAVYLTDLLEKTRFEDGLKIKKMLFRYICRNFETSLDQKYHDKWIDFCKNRINEGVYTQSFEDYFKEIDEFKELYKDDEKRMKVLDDLIIYGNQVKDFLYNKVN